MLLMSCYIHIRRIFASVWFNEQWCRGWSHISTHFDSCYSSTAKNVSFGFLMMITFLHIKSAHWILKEMRAKYILTVVTLFSQSSGDFCCCWIKTEETQTFSVQRLLSCDRWTLYWYHYNNIKQRKSCNKSFYNRAVMFDHETILMGGT